MNKFQLIKNKNKNKNPSNGLCICGKKSVEHSSPFHSIVVQNG